MLENLLVCMIDKIIDTANKNPESITNEQINLLEKALQYFEQHLIADCLNLKEKIIVIKKER